MNNKVTFPLISPCRGSFLTSTIYQDSQMFFVWKCEAKFICKRVFNPIQPWKSTSKVQYHHGDQNHYNYTLLPDDTFKTLFKTMDFISDLSINIAAKIKICT